MKRFYQIIQYGKLRCTHPDIEYKTDKQLKEVCNRIVERAKRAIAKNEMVSGLFDVAICDEQGNELDSFLCGTDYIY